MNQQIEPGATVECIDYPLGVVERQQDDGTLVVRPARADYLLAIPPSLIESADRGWVRLNAMLEDVEQYALRGQPAGSPVEMEPTSPGPRADEVLGRQPGEPPTSPPTG